MKFYPRNLLQFLSLVNFCRFHELVRSGQPFTALDYTAETPAWAQFGSEHRGFDPGQKRFHRKGKKALQDG